MLPLCIRLLILLSIAIALISLSNTWSGMEYTDLHKLKQLIPFHKMKNISLSHWLNTSYFQQINCALYKVNQSLYDLLSTV